MDEFPQDIDATSIRSGAIQELAGHPLLNGFDVALRSGHQAALSKENRAYEYTHCTPSATLIGAMALARYRNCRAKCFTARLVFYSGMSEKLQISMTNLMNSLFQSDINFGPAKTQLYHCMFATG